MNFSFDKSMSEINEINLRDNTGKNIKKISSAVVTDN